MGVFEMASFEKGTKSMMDAVVEATKPTPSRSFEAGTRLLAARDIILRTR
jgi:3-phosphoglycerate kinase